MMKRGIFIFSALLLCAVLTFISCSSSNMSKTNDDLSDLAPGYGENNSSRKSESKDNDGGASAGSDSSIINTEINQSRKVIYTATIDIETLEFDAGVKMVKQLTEKFGGYFESSDITGGKRGGDDNYYELRSAVFTIRIPLDRFSDFLDRKNEIGNVYKDVTKAQDVTLQYQDNESRLISLRLQEERVLVILEKADKLTDLFEIESTLANIRYEIETLASKQLLLSSQVEYSTAYISLYEVRSITKTQDKPLTLSDRISHRFNSTIEGLKTFGEDFLVWLLGDSILILIWGTVITVVVLILIKMRKKNMKKAVANNNTNQPQNENK